MTPSSDSIISISAEERFCCYYESWLRQLEGHLQELVLRRRTDYESIVASLTTHHKAYYAAKWALAHEDVLAIFSPHVWASPLEVAFHWVTGWKPSTAFRLVDSLRRTRTPLTSLAQLTETQAQMIQELRVRIRSEEERVEREMERQQVALGDRKMVELARVAGRCRGKDAKVDGLTGLLEGFEKAMKMADYTRLKTLKGLLDVLSPRQGVDFLAVFAMIQIQTRKMGKARANTSSNGCILSTIVPTNIS